MIKDGTKKRLIEELSKTGNILFSCSKVGIGRATYYRWKDRYPSFKAAAERAESLGREDMTDVAEAALLTNVKKGDQRAIEFTLKHNSERYRPSYGKFDSNSARNQPLPPIKIQVVEPKDYRKNKGTNVAEGN